MKAISTFSIIIVLFLSTTIRAQQIASINLSPVAPSNSDTIKVITGFSFPNSPCIGGSSGYTVTGNVINIKATYCIGALTALCSDVDTLKINPLPVGTYTVYYSLYSGTSTPTCIPGNNPNDVDTLILNTTPTGISKNGNIFKNNLSFFPNPVKEKLTIQSEVALPESAEIIIQDALGIVIGRWSCNNSKSVIIPTNEIKSGIYYVKINSGNSVFTQKIVILK